jgi:phosphatidylglycerophosphate synthase
MAPMSWQLPGMPLLRRVVLIQSLALMAVAVVSIAAVSAMPVSAGYPLKAMLVFAAIAIVSIGHAGAHHPFESFGAANIVTTGRAGLVALAAGLVGEARADTTTWAAAVFALSAAALDGVDGWLARRSGLSSTFGARFDMEIDALLILALAIVAWEQGKAGAWIVLAGAMRYLFVGASYVWQWLDAPLPPSTRRKAVCVVQVVGLGALVTPLVPVPLSVALAAATLAMLTWSFAVDVIWLRRHSA